MNQNIITKMLEYEPYSYIMKNYEFAYILFENEGLMTITKNFINSEKSQNDKSDKQINNFKSKKKLFKFK